MSLSGVGGSERLRLLAHALSVFVSAWLIFQVQPMVGKALLPRFGGSPAIWSLCLLAFQSLLLLGYLGAYLLARRAGAWPLLGYALVLLGALASLPVVPQGQGDVPELASPVLAAALAIAGSAALPFVVLAMTTPLLSALHERQGGAAPYRLYAYSNAGSLLGLLSYPVLVEPALALPAQAGVWGLAFALLSALLLWCVGSGLRSPVGPATAKALQARPGAEPATATTMATAAGPGRWLLLSCVPSVSLLAITNHLTVDVAAVPLLWVVPLALYLLSFILTFGSERAYRRALWLPLWMAFALSAAAALLAHGSASVLHQLTSFLGLLFCGCMLCHGELSRARPPADRVATFYLWVSLGGAAGGLFVALLAPLIFDAFLELQLSVVATGLLMWWLWPRAKTFEARGSEGLWLGFGLALVVPAMLVAAYFQLAERGRGAEVIERSRSFHGMLRVTRTEDATILSHGRIRHGMEFRSSARRGQPTMYFGPSSAVGRVLGAAGEPRRVGVVGLGAGTLASYGRAGDRFDFYELDPDVVRLARRHFSYLAGSAAKLQVRVGDGRRSLSQLPPQGYDVLILDAFASDSVPTHLLSLEAFEIYLQHLQADGLLLCNVSNRHLDLQRVVAGAAAHHGLVLRVRETPSNIERGEARVRWALLSRRALALPPWLRAPDPEIAARVQWTDTYSDLLSVLRR
ncbi:MAG: fused MFS/spermidine synthase [Myxococcales bacterium]|nr:fused MFS/spermidine synthase [Myxococcales bacterium]